MRLLPTQLTTKSLPLALAGVLTFSILSALSTSAQALGRSGNSVASQQSGLSAKQAAMRAKAAHGGRVLSVKRNGDTYRVKLLLDSGRVKIVSVRI